MRRLISQCFSCWICVQKSTTAPVTMPSGGYWPRILRIFCFIFSVSRAYCISSSSSNPRKRACSYLFCASASSARIGSDMAWKIILSSFVFRTISTRIRFLCTTYRSRMESARGERLAKSASSRRVLHKWGWFRQRSRRTSSKVISFLMAMVSR